MSLRRFVPSEHQDQREVAAAAEKEKREKQAAEAAALKRAVNRVLDSEDGRVLWRWIFDECGWVRPALSQGQVGGDLAPLRTECLAALRDFYRRLRALADPDLRVAAEDFAENGTAVAGPTKKKEK